LNQKSLENFAPKKVGRKNFRKINSGRKVKRELDFSDRKIKA